MDPLKDLETLIRAFALVREVLPESRLRLFGPIPEGNEDYKRGCLQLVEDLGMGVAVSFEGPSTPLEAYRAGHVVVLSSILEALPYTVLEAMAAGRPVVATDVGGVGEAVGDAGLLVPPREPGVLAAACLRLLNDEGQRDAMGKLARLRVLSQFTAERCFGAYRSLYGRLGGGRLRVLATRQPFGLKERSLQPVQEREEVPA